MSKMTMPEMNAVRFQESDVIVASGFYLLSNTHDATGWNMTFQYPDGSYIVNNDNGQSRVDYADQFGTSDQLKFYYSQNSFITLKTLIDNDSAQTPQSTSGVDGEYSWDGSFFVRRGLKQ